MKEGFYVSPDGKQVIQLIQSKDWKHGLDIIVLDDSGCIDKIGDLPKEDVHIIFSTWGLLK